MNIGSHHVPFLHPLNQAPQMTKSDKMPNQKVRHINQEITQVLPGPPRALQSTGAWGQRPPDRGIQRHFGIHHVLGVPAWVSISSSKALEGYNRSIPWQLYEDLGGTRFRMKLIMKARYLPRNLNPRNPHHAVPCSIPRPMTAHIGFS